MDIIDRQYVKLIAGFTLCAFYFIWYVYKHHKPDTPEELLRNINKMELEQTLPKYALIDAVKNALRHYPDNKELLNKLYELEKLAESQPELFSQKPAFKILFISIGILSIVLIVSWFYEKAHISAFYIGLVYLLGAALIYRQYRKER